MSHLWEVDHSYYCSEGNYFSNDCTASYKSLSEFLEAEGSSDLDMNLVFRWDWREGPAWGAGDYAGDDNYRNGLLNVFIVGQRKGLFRSATVQVCRADEDAVRGFLAPRLAHLLALWAPLDLDTTGPSTVPGGQTK